MAPSHLASNLAFVVDLDSQLTPTQLDVFHGHCFERELPQTVTEWHKRLPWLHDGSHVCAERVKKNATRSLPGEQESNYWTSSTTAHSKITGGLDYETRSSR